MNKDIVEQFVSGRITLEEARSLSEARNKLAEAVDRQAWAESEAIRNSFRMKRPG